jgi:hypothetical protein
VQEVSAPPLGDPGNVRHFVADSSRHQDPPSGHCSATGQSDDEPGLDAQHLVVDQLHAVAGDLVASFGQ